MKQPTPLFILAKIESRHSHKNGGDYWLLTWIDTEQARILETSVDPQYDNYKNWAPIINNKKPLGIYDNLKLSQRTTKNGTAIISADSLPRQLDPLSSEEVELVVEALFG